MSFDGRSILVAGLVEIQLPDATLRLCDGGFVKFDGQTFRSAEPDWGAIGALEGVDERIGDEAPGMTMTLLPASDLAADAMIDPGVQNSPVRLWLVEVDPATGAADEAGAELVADMLVDTAAIKFGRNSLAVEVGMISAADKLFSMNEGNALNSSFHQSVWPGEQGFDNAIDVGVTVAWRSKAPPRGSTGGAASGGSGGGFDFFGLF